MARDRVVDRLIDSLRQACRSSAEVSRKCRGTLDILSCWDRAEGSMGRVARGVCGTTGVPMSRYGYDFSPTPRPKGWRVAVRNVLLIGTIAAISAISGGVVARG